MAKAYLKVNVRPGKERTIKETLIKINGVRSAELTAGEQDLIVLIEAGSYDDILNMVVNELRNIDGVEKTITNLVTD